MWILSSYFNAARGFVGGAADQWYRPWGKGFVSMPHAALWVVQPRGNKNALRAVLVSMPHAALWVVQHHRKP